ncbi:MAG TPA: VOC family protein [Steroidobacteraceae bacterium]|nr:VOC family protein [Steroidobacteraceae bacterium]
MRRAKSTPDGWHSVTPRLVVHDPALLVRFRICGACAARGGNLSFLYVYVDDVDATYLRALQAGAASIEEPQDVPYGDRRRQRY